MASSPLYQVVSAHPHDIRELTPYIETVKQDGRLWLVHLKEGAPAQVLKHLRPTQGLGLKSYSFSAAQKKTILVSPLIKDFTNRVDEASLKADVETLSNFKTRLVGTSDNQKTYALLKDLFSKLGMATSEYCYKVGACSVVAQKAGDGSTQDVILIMAHFDSVGKDFAGADDNGSGTASLLEIARVLKDYSNKKHLRFFATNGEESGLYGAQHYANVLKAAGTLSRVKLAINMDMVGYNSNGIVELETNAEYDTLAQWFATLAQEYTTLKPKITLGAWGSDHVPFLEGGVPTLLTIEDWSTKTPFYHGPGDKPNTLNYEYAAEITKLNIAAIMTKDVE
jgi:hypothetical protein